MSSHILGHSFKLEHVYIESIGSVCGPLEYHGPLGGYFDKHYDDFYCGEKSFEKAERHLLEDAVSICLKKANLEIKDIDMFLGSDLLNQNITVNYLARNILKPFLSIYSACSGICSTSAIMSLLIEGHLIDRGLVMVASHNKTAERQFRYPNEYGVQKRNTSTFTATGAVSVLLSHIPSKIKVESITIGRVVDYRQKDPNDMGRAMAPAAYDTLLQHFKDLNRNYEDYDLIVTGDLSQYGSKLLKAMFVKNGMSLSHYNDCGNMLYDKKQDVNQGGSGCACSALVTMGYLCSLLEKGQLKKVLLVATGALLSPVMSGQKESIPSIAHALSLEANL